MRFFDEMREGDRICLVGCARFPRWVDHVEAAKVLVWVVDNLTEGGGKRQWGEDLAGFKSPDYIHVGKHKKRWLGILIVVSVRTRILQGRL